MKYLNKERKIVTAATNKFAIKMIKNYSKL